jgi:hypothetical protein
MAWYDGFKMRSSTWGGKLTPKGSQLTKEEGDSNMEILLTQVDAISGTGAGSQPTQVPDWVITDAILPNQIVKYEDVYYQNITAIIQTGVNPASNPAIFQPIPTSQIFQALPVYVELTENDLVVEGDYLVFNITHNRNTELYNLIVRDSTNTRVLCNDKPIDANSLKIYINNAEPETYKIIIF